MALAVGLWLAPGGAADAQGDLSLDARTRVLEHWIEDQVTYHAVPGVVVGVVTRDGLAWSGAWGHADRAAGRPMTTTTPLRMGSVSKIFTSTAIVRLAEQGRVDLDAPVSTYLPWFRLALRGARGGSAAGADGERWRAQALDGSGITLRHLLTHTGGLPREAAVPYWTDHVFPDTDELAGVVAMQHALWPPGFDYQYSNLGMGLLGEIVAAVSGTSFAAALDGLILDPLGMEDSTAEPDAAMLSRLAAGYMRRLPDGSRTLFEYYDTGALAGAANVISTLEDMARFAVLHLQSADAGRPVSGERLIAPEALRAMQTAQWARDSLSSARGLGFSVTARDGERVASHGGWIAGHRSHLIVVPDSGLAVVAMVNADDVSPSFFAQQALEVLGPVLGDGGSSDDRAPSGDDGASDLTELEGTYSDPWAWYYEVMVLDGDLYFYEHGYPPSDEALDNLTRLEPDGEGGFVFGSARDPVRFERGDDGAVVRILRRSDYLFPVGPDGAIAVDMP